jgi:hypothetical protein
MNATPDPERLGKALDLMIEGEQKLLAVFDARQASADTKTAAAVAAAVAVPTLTLTLGKSLAQHEAWLNVTYGLVVLAVTAAVLARAWSGHRRRTYDVMSYRQVLDEKERRDAAAKQGSGRARRAPKQLTTESMAAKAAREDWWRYQVKDGKTRLDGDDVNAVRELALTMWRARAADSRQTAQDKELVTLFAALAFVFALIASAVLVVIADF